MNREELKKQIVINFKKDEITEKERLINVMQCIDAHIEQLSIPRVVVSDADIYLASADEEVDLLDARGFRQGAKWCRRQY